MLLVLLRARGRMAGNVVRASTGWQRLLAVCLSAAGGVVFWLVAALCAALLRQAQGNDPLSGGLSDAAASLVFKTDNYLFLFLLAGAVPFVAAALFGSDDLPLLLSTPLPPRAIVAAKLADAALVNGSQALALGLPVLVGLGWGMALSAGGWLWLLTSTVLLLTLTPAAVALLLLAAARVLGMRRVRAAVTVVSIGLGLAIMNVAVQGANHAVQSGTLNFSALRAALQGHPAVAPRPLAASAPPDAGPAAWATAMLRDTAGGHNLRADGARGLGLLTLTTIALVGLCLPLGTRVLTSDAFLEPPGAARRRMTARRPTSRPRLCSPVTAAILIKDTLCLRRDLILQGQIGTTLLLFLVPFALRIGPGFVSPADRDLYGWLALGLLGLIAYMVTSIAGLSSVGLEGRGAWIVLGAPIRRGAMLRAKHAGAFGLSLAVTTLGLLIDWPAFALPGPIVGLTWLALCAACYALAGLGVGLSGLFPRFVYENPAHRASLWAMLLDFTLANVYSLLCALLAGGAYLATPTFGAARAWGGGMALFALLSTATGTLPIALAAKRLEYLDWEF